jgi:site-specific recombinase XerD
MPAQPPGFTPIVKQWFDKLALKSEGTAKGYFSNLKTYWNSLTAQGFSTIDDWVALVKQEQKSDEVNVRRGWAVNLESFINSYVSPSTDRLLSSDSKNTMRAAIQNYLTYCLGNRLETSYKFDYGTKTERLLEQRAKEDTAPLSREEIAKLYTEAKNRRNRAIISTLMCGFGISEWLQFTHEWSKYADDIHKRKVPIRVTVTRQKTGITYACLLWDDAVSDLKELLDERERDLGRPLGKNDPLFVNQSERPITDQDVSKTIRRLAVGSGVEERHSDADKGKSYRLRVHEIGRDFFKTQAQLTGIRDIVSEYLLGHKVDPLEYGKFHQTDEGKELIQKEASKLRSLLNIRTGKGQPDSDVEAELEAAERTVKLLLPGVYEKYKLVARQLTTEQALEWLRNEISQQPKKQDGPEYMRINESEADNHLNHGYEFVQVLPSGKLLIRKKKD